MSNSNRGHSNEALELLLTRLETNLADLSKSNISSGKEVAVLAENVRDITNNQKDLMRVIFRGEGAPSVMQDMNAFRLKIKMLEVQIIELKEAMSKKEEGSLNFKLGIWVAVITGVFGTIAALISIFS